MVRGIVDGYGERGGSRECGGGDETFGVCGVVVGRDAAARGAADAEAGVGAIGFGGVGEEGYCILEDRVREGAEGGVEEAGGWDGG